MLKKGMTLFIVLCVLVGCSSQAQLTNDEGNEMVDGHNHDVHLQEEDAAQETDVTQEADAEIEERQFSLDAVIHEENDKYYLHIETDLTFSEENYGRQHVYGEGHVHFYVKNRLIGPIRNADPYEVTEYVTDNDEDVTIKLVLAGNNHREPYGVQKEIVVPAK